MQQLSWKALHPPGLYCFRCIYQFGCYSEDIIRFTFYIILLAETWGKQKSIAFELVSFFIWFKMRYSTKLRSLILHFRAFRFFARLIYFGKQAEWKNLNVPQMFSNTVKNTPDKVMFYYEEQTWSFKQVSITILHVAL